MLVGAFDKAIEEAKVQSSMEKGSLTSYFALHEAMVLASAGRKQEAESIVEGAIVEKEKVAVSSTGIGWVLAVLGRKDEAFAWMERAFAEQDPALLYFNGFPWTKEIRTDQRWRAIESRFPFKSVPD